MRIIMYIVCLCDIECAYRSTHREWLSVQACQSCFAIKEVNCVCDILLYQQILQFVHSLLGILQCFIDNVYTHVLKFIRFLL